MYHYAGNNPVKYTDPDGKKIHKLTDLQWTVVKNNLNNLSANLGTLITKLDECNNTAENLDSKIIDSARMYITSEFGSLPLDISAMKSILSNLKKHIDSLDRNDFRYDDKTNAFAYTNPFFDDIYLGDIFFETPDSGGYDTKEGTILHEVTHYIFMLRTADYTYKDEEMRKLPDNGVFKSKQNNANNWEYFYEKIFD